VALLKLNHLAYCIAMEMLVDGDASTRAMADETGLNLTTIQAFIRTAKQRGTVHISAWDYDRYNKPSIPLYKFGSRPDAPRPKKTIAQISRDYRANRARREKHAVVQAALTGQLRA